MNKPKCLIFLNILIFLFMGALGLYQFQNAWNLIFSRPWNQWASLLIFGAAGGLIGFVITAFTSAKYIKTEKIFLGGALVFIILYGVMHFIAAIDRFYLIALLIFLLPFSLIMLEDFLYKTLNTIESKENGSWLIINLVVLMPFVMKIVPNLGFAIYLVQVYFYLMVGLIFAAGYLMFFEPRFNKKKSEKEAKSIEFNRQQFRIMIGPTHFMFVALSSAIFAGLVFLTYFDQSRNHFFTFLLHMSEISMYPADILVKPMFYAAICGSFGSQALIWLLSRVKMARWLQILGAIFIESLIVGAGLLIYFSRFPLLDPQWMVFNFTVLVLLVFLWPINLLGYRINRVKNSTLMAVKKISIL